MRAGVVTPDADLARQREVVEAFLAASREGDFGALLALLDPDVVLQADRAAVDTAASRQDSGAPPLSPGVRGASAVVEAFSGRTGAARLAIVNGFMEAVWAPRGRPRAVFAFKAAREDRPNRDTRRPCAPTAARPYPSRRLRLQLVSKISRVSYAPPNEKGRNN